MVCEIFSASKGSPFIWILPRQLHSEEAAGMLCPPGFQIVFCTFSVLVAFLGLSGVSFRVLSSVLYECF